MEELNCLGDNLKISDASQACWQNPKSPVTQEDQTFKTYAATGYGNACL